MSVTFEFIIGKLTVTNFQLQEQLEEARRRIEELESQVAQVEPEQES